MYMCIVVTWAYCTINYTCSCHEQLTYPLYHAQTFPSDMEFHWVFFNESDIPVIALKADDSLSSDVQLTAGMYMVAVTGNSSIGIATSTIAIAVEGE